ARLIQRLRVVLFRMRTLPQMLATQAMLHGPKVIADWAATTIPTTLPKLAGPVQDTVQGGGGTPGQIRTKLDPNTMPTPPPGPA
ncbi:hypothetical protein ACFQ07_09475, partial [Actinomadura adrarensis]